MATKDPTFVKFNAEQAAKYAQGRGYSYPRPIYDAILAYHQGPQNVHLDIGTGPGKVIFDLHPHFTHSIGSDPSAAMIAEALSAANTLALSPAPVFLQGAGEDCATTLNTLGHEQADLITTAMSAHWLHLPTFYASAARALRPGGTLALWTCTSMYAHPSTPNAGAVRAVLRELEDETLAPYQNSGTRLTRAAYSTLDLPWTVVPPVAGFEKSGFVRREWDRDGVPSAPNAGEDGGEGPFLFDWEVSVEDLERGMGSASSVIRYREANPDVAGGAEDVVVVAGRKLREAVGGVGRLRVSPSTHLLLMRRA